MDGMEAKPKQKIDKRIVLGWISVGLGTLVATLWAAWGILENFHEGWWMPTLPERLLGGLMYLTPMIITILLTLTAILWPRVGGAIIFVAGVVFTWLIFKERIDNLTLAIVLSWLPVTAVFILVGVLYWFSRVNKKKLAIYIVIGIPLLAVIGLAIEPAIRVSQRVDDGNRAERHIVGNGVELVWAPEGPGWALNGENVDPLGNEYKNCVDWWEAKERCAHLSADGTTIMEDEQNIWRLPTVDEAVRSLTRGGENAGGVWDPVKKRATYDVMPDKESPLWVPYSETIYWWTADEADEEEAYKVVFNGQVWPVPKKYGPGYLGFRAVREP